MIIKGINDSNPSPFNMSKYSQPLELVLLHIIKANINCHNGFYYSHLLIN